MAHALVIVEAVSVSSRSIVWGLCSEIPNKSPVFEGSVTCNGVYDGGTVLVNRSITGRA